MRRSHSAIATGLCFLLTSCSLFSGGDKSQEDATALGGQGATSGISAVAALEGGAAALFPRPSASLGLYIAAYLSQGIFLPVRSAWIGIEAQKALFARQGDPDTDETFTLLQELGNILQVDVPDILNRSPNRRETLDQYLQTLHNVFVLAERKHTELESAAETLKEEEREKRNAAQDLEREINRALDNKDYTGAGSRQRELTEAQGDLAEVETKREQTEDIKDRFKELLDVAKDRVVAIEANRLILIAGLQVIELPGVEDLDILLDRGRRQRRNSTGIGADKLF